MRAQLPQIWRPECGMAHGYSSEYHRLHAVFQELAVLRLTIQDTCGGVGQLVPLMR